MYLENRTNSIEHQGHRSKVKVMFSLMDQSLPKQLPNYFHPTWKQIVVHKAVFGVWIA